MRRGIEGRSSGDLNQNVSPFFFFFWCMCGTRDNIRKRDNEKRDPIT